jgi:hypothetical protein
MDDGVVARYANVIASGRLMPPIKVALVNGAPVVVDGWHRIAAHEWRGEKQITAHVVIATEREAQWLAAAANLSHGLPLKPREVRTAFRAFIKARQHIRQTGRLLSYRDIAEAMGGLVVHTTLRNWMKADFPRIAQKMAEGDTVRAVQDQTTDTEAGFMRLLQRPVAFAIQDAEVN